MFIDRSLPAWEPTIILLRVTTNAYRRIIHQETGQVLVERARWCDDFASRLRGFTFRRSLLPGEGLVLVEEGDSRVNAGITMLFCFIDLGVLWVDSGGAVVDKIVAHPWRISYLPGAPARFAVEASPEIVNRVEIGDHIDFLPLKVDADGDSKS